MVDLICPERRRVWDAMGLEERLAAADAVVGGGLATLPDPHCLLIACPGCGAPALDLCLDALEHATSRILGGMGNAAEECRARANRCAPEAVEERRHWTARAERWETRIAIMLSTWEAEDETGVASVAWALEVGSARLRCVRKGRTFEVQAFQGPGPAGWSGALARDRDVHELLRAAVDMTAIGELLRPRRGEG